MRSPFSVFVLRDVILVSCLYAVTRMTEALPVALIPEENLVTSMWLDVIHISCLDIASTLQTLYAQRMRFKVTLASFVPRPAVASAVCGACVLRMEGTVLVTVLRTIGNERCTAGMSARCIWFAGHRHCLHSFHCDRAVSPAVVIVGCGRSEQRPSYTVVGRPICKG